MNTFSNILIGLGIAFGTFMIVVVLQAMNTAQHAIAALPF